jgi:hypothetical protein
VLTGTSLSLCGASRRATGACAGRGRLRRLETATFSTDRRHIKSASAPGGLYARFEAVARLLRTSASERSVSSQPRQKLKRRQRQVTHGLHRSRGARHRHRTRSQTRPPRLRRAPTEPTGAYSSTEAHTGHSTVCQLLAESGARRQTHSNRRARSWGDTSATEATQAGRTLSGEAAPGRMRTRGTGAATSERPIG